MGATTRSANDYIPDTHKFAPAFQAGAFFGVKPGCRHFFVEQAALSLKRRICSWPTMPIDGGIRPGVMICLRHPGGGPASPHAAR